MNIEPLEPRIAPASAFVTYTDFDGDLVKITASKPGSVAPPLDGSHLTLASFVGPLVILDLTDPAFGGAKIVFTVTKKPGGDGLANVGRINATGVDLDQVVVKGTLGEIVAGDATTAGDPGLNLLSVLGMGEVGPSTATHLFNSTITGKLGALKVAGDFTDAFLRVVGGADGQLGAVTITGDVTGLGGTSAGRVDSEGAMGVVKIGGDLRGGAPFGTGLISSGTSIGAITIGGGVFGGAGESSGRLESAGTMGNVKITGSLTGGTGSNSGAIVATGLGSVTIGGSVFGAKTDPGGSHNRTGVIESLGTMGAVKIGGDVDAGVLATSGYISTASDASRRSPSPARCLAARGSAAAGSRPMKE